MQRSAGVPPASVPGVPPGVLHLSTLNSQPSTVFTALTPVEQSAFKKKLDRKFRPIPALVAVATQEKINVP